MIDRFGAIMVNTSEAVVDPAILKEPEAILRNGPSRHIAAPLKHCDWPIARHLQHKTPF